jgi:hypothetical protein
VLGVLGGLGVPIQAVGVLLLLGVLGYRKQTAQNA